MVNNQQTGPTIIGGGISPNKAIEEQRQAALKASIVNKREKEKNKRKKQLTALALSGTLLLVGGLGGFVLSQSGIIENIGKDTSLGGRIDDATEEMETQKAIILSKLKEEIYQGVSQTISDSITPITKDNGQTGHSYNFNGAGDSGYYYVALINSLSESNLSPETSLNMIKNLSEEEYKYIMISLGIGTIKNYEGGPDNKAAFIRDLLGHEAASEYQRNPEVFMNKINQEAEKTLNEWVNIILEQNTNDNDLDAQKIAEEALANFNGKRRG